MATRGVQADHLWTPRNSAKSEEWHGRYGPVARHRLRSRRGSHCRSCTGSGSRFCSNGSTSRAAISPRGGGRNASRWRAVWHGFSQRPMPAAPAHPAESAPRGREVARGNRAPDIHKVIHIPTAHTARPGAGVPGSSSRKGTNPEVIKYAHPSISPRPVPRGHCRSPRSSRTRRHIRTLRT